MDVFVWNIYRAELFLNLAASPSVHFLLFHLSSSLEQVASEHFRNTTDLGT